jgi:hypothetical protein
MNTLCLEKYGVSQMETKEMKTVDGGKRIETLKWIGKWLLNAIGAADALEDLRDGFNEGNSGDCC